MINVACAIILSKDMVLAVQRGKGQDQSGKWEFPGGKVETNESEEEGLIREIREELCVDISIDAKLSPVEYVYEKYSIRLTPFFASILAGELSLTEHQDYRWLSPETLHSVDWAPADWSIVYQLQKRWNVNNDLL